LIGRQVFRLEVAVVPADEVVQRAEEEPAHEEAQREQREGERPAAKKTDLLDLELGFAGFSYSAVTVIEYFRQLEF
jgi:hypothetical protein